MNLEAKASGADLYIAQGMEWLESRVGRIAPQVVPHAPDKASEIFLPDDLIVAERTSGQWQWMN